MYGCFGSCANILRNVGDILVEKEMILEMITKEYENHETLDSKTMNNIAKRIYPALPNDDEELMELFDFLVSNKSFWLVTVWIKRKGLYQLEFMPYYEKWLYDHVNRWGLCDVFCYRVLNPMVEKYPQLFEKVMEWADSSKTYVRRAAPVSLIQSTRSFVVNSSIQNVLLVVEKLKHDKENHVQKGVGWLLKYAYLTYPDEVYHYLKDNVDNLSRTIFRYALEKTPKHIKEELMSL